jgi:hypothetical protein
LNRLLNRQVFQSDPWNKALQDYIPKASRWIESAVDEYFSEHIKPGKLIISPEFQLMVGGPKWLQEGATEIVCVRKYIGIRGQGDFLAVFSFPKVAMDYYRVIHSHSHPDRWLEDPYYGSHIPFASIRHPLDILNSATFSINALTGDYIDNHIRMESEIVREKLGLYKLTDLNFLEGLLNPLHDYLRSFLQVQNSYSVMRWENLIEAPVQTIRWIGENAGLPVTDSQAAAMWEAMKFKNQTTHHRHNFRKGVIGDWKSHLLNEHLDIIKSHGIDELMQMLGYGRIEYLDRKQYTPFQKRVESFVRANRICYEFDDPDLFMFAFNKSNFRSDKYDFVSYTGNGLVQIERSSIKDEPLLRGFMEVLDCRLRPINDTINHLFNRFRA